MTTYAYYVNGDNSGGKTHAIYVSSYNEIAQTWSTRAPIKINGKIDGNAVDPDVQVMSDGRLLLTYMRGQFSTTNPETTPSIYQAWSLDGVNFFDAQVVYKPSSWTTAPMPPVTDPSNVKLANGSWLMAVSLPSSSSATLFTAASDRQYTATHVDTATFSPDFQLLSDGTIRIFYAGGGGISSLSSRDGGLTWSADAGLRISGMYYDPSVFQNADGTWSLLIKTQSGSTDPSNPLAGHNTSLAASIDGLNFTVTQADFASAASVAEGVNFTPINLLNAKGTAYVPASTVQELICYTDGSYGLLFNASGKWSEQKFAADGKISGKSSVLSKAQVLDKEHLLHQDLNDDDAIGHIIATLLDDTAYVSSSTALSLYETVDHLYMLDAAHQSVGASLSDDRVCLMSSSKAAWTLKSGSVVGIAQRDSGDIEVLTKSGTSYTVQAFDFDSGYLQGKATKLKSTELAAREYFYNQDLNGDGSISLVGLSTDPSYWNL